MRNAKAQRGMIMSRVVDTRQLGGPHVRHADFGGSSDANLSCSQDGQRCALLTTKSRKTCTRATVFSSSG